MLLVPPKCKQILVSHQNTQLYNIGLFSIAPHLLINSDSCYYSLILKAIAKSKVGRAITLERKKRKEAKKS